jgi:uncharacterized zinc-type alcohol dehydrogenase-like protein
VLVALRPKTRKNRTVIEAFAQHAVKTPLERIELPDPPPPAGHEIDVEVLHCSVCHSDVHLLDGDWGDVARPLVPGHEIVGRRTSDGVLVGVGWQAGAGGACTACETGREHLCTGGKVRTCVNRQGGFATRVRVDARFAFEIPKGIDPAAAAPLFCAGLTVFSPLERLGVRSGMSVGVVGLGGLGHLAVRFASALGAHVTAFDLDGSKRDLALSLGAVGFESVGERASSGFDLIVVTTHAVLDWDGWMKMLALEGTLCLVGVPSKNIEVNPDRLLDEQKKITGSVIGSPATMKRMLAFAGEKKIAPIVERMPMSRVNDAIARVRAGQARMRVVRVVDP